MNQYNYLIVGSGLFGTTMAYLLHQKGYKCLVIDKRPHIGGNVYTESVNGINVHKYGARMGVRELFCGVQSVHQLSSGKI